MVYCGLLWWYILYYYLRGRLGDFVIIEVRNAKKWSKM